MSVVLCRRNRCDQTKEPVVVAGRVVFVCWACERNAKGFCRRCPKKLDRPKALRCDTCDVEVDRENAKARCRRRVADQAEYAKMKKARRERYKNPEIRARELAQNKEWRKNNPFVSTPFSRLAHRVDMQQRRSNPGYVDQVNRRRRERGRFTRMAVRSGLPRSEWRQMEALEVYAWKWYGNRVREQRRRQRILESPSRKAA